MAFMFGGILMHTFLSENLTLQSSYTFNKNKKAQFRARKCDRRILEVRESSIEGF